MRTLLKNARMANVFTGEFEPKDILMEDGIILYVKDALDEALADEVHDLSGLTLLPGFIDGHIHIESTMLTPPHLAKVLVEHGTTAIIADPHEIANVKGQDGLEFMLESSEGLPVDMYFMLPSCVPAADLEESGAVLMAEDLRPFYKNPRVLGLGEVMSYPAVLAKDPDMMRKIQDAKDEGKIINGHAPLLSGTDLDEYITAGIGDDHECSILEEAKERIAKGQHVLIRQGTAAKNLPALVELLRYPTSRRCLFAVDDIHPSDLVTKGHIDSILREAVGLGADPMQAITAATLNAAEYYGLKNQGAIAPGYKGDLVAVEDVRDFKVTKVYKNGQLIFDEGVCTDIPSPKISEDLHKAVSSSFGIKEAKPEDFHFDLDGIHTARIIGIEPGSLISECLELPVDFDRDNGVNLDEDIVKISVLERHKGNGHKALGLLKGSGLKEGAVASSICHDAHNLVVLGTNEKDMAAAAMRVIENQGGLAAAKGGSIVAQLPLNIAGIMTDQSAAKTAIENKEVIDAIQSMGASTPEELLMTMSFMCLPVIPALKLTTSGLFDSKNMKLTDLIID